MPNQSPVCLLRSVLLVLGCCLAAVAAGQVNSNSSRETRSQQDEQQQAIKQPETRRPAARLPPNGVSNNNEEAQRAAAANNVARLLKLQQTSACDGETLRIKCNDDYVIDVIAAEHTILHQELLVPAASSQQQLPGTEPPICLPGSTSSHATNLLSLPAQAGNDSSGCSPQQAKSRALGRDLVFALVRTECRARNSCQLELAWPRKLHGDQFTGNGLLPNNSTINVNVNAVVAGPVNSSAAAYATQQRMSTVAASQASAPTNSNNVAKLARLLNEACPLNRKLVEVAYKCRPSKLSRRTICRGDQLRLDCPQDKRLLVASAEFGAQAGEAKLHERCLPALLLNQTGAAPQPALPLNQSCLVEPAKVMATLEQHCLFKSACQLPVEPALLGETRCPADQAEYLRLVFTCVNQTLLSMENGPPPVKPHSVDNSSQVLASELEARRPRDNSLEWGAAAASLEEGQRLHEILRADPELGARPPTQWSPAQRLRFLLARYQTQAVALGVLSCLLLLLALGARSCTRQRVGKKSSKCKFGPQSAGCGSASSAVSSASSSASGCSHSSSMGLFGSSASSSANKQSNNQLQANNNCSPGNNASPKLRNSCSESCFSLDADNPLLLGAATNNVFASHQQQQQPSSLSPSQQQSGGTLARPRLWTIYGQQQQAAEQQQRSHLRIGAHHTLRPTRTFLGQQPMNQQGLLLALQAAPPPMPPSAPGWSAGELPGGAQFGAAPQLTAAAAAPPPLAQNNCELHQQQCLYQQARCPQHQLLQQQQQQLYAANSVGQPLQCELRQFAPT